MHETAAVVLDSVSKRFTTAGRRLEVLRALNLAIRPGEFLCVVGGSGCGKSTLLRLIAGLEMPSEGCVTVDGRPVTGPGSDRAVVFQEPRLLPWLTVEQNVAFGLQSGNAAEQRWVVADNLRLVGLTGFESAYPGQLSGGMAQRVGLARALANRPKVLLLDEPFGALDALTRLQMQQEVRRIHRIEQSTTVLVTHDIDEALLLGDRVVVLSRERPDASQQFDVPLPHPRETTTAAYASLRQDILRVIFDGSPLGPN